MIIIAAMASNRVIGRAGALPWNVPEEYRQFLGFVRGHAVIMGRTSYEIFGKDLAESKLIVVSRSLKELPDAEVRPGVDSAIQAARSHGTEVFSAGGASIYRQTIPLAAAMYLSIVKGSFEGDTFFPRFDEDEWTVTRTEDHPRFEFRVYERRSGAAQGRGE